MQYWWIYPPVIESCGFTSWVGWPMKNTVVFHCTGLFLWDHRTTFRIAVRESDLPEKFQLLGRTSAPQKSGAERNAWTGMKSFQSRSSSVAHGTSPLVGWSTPECWWLKSPSSHADFRSHENTSWSLVKTCYKKKPWMISIFCADFSHAEAPIIFFLGHPLRKTPPADLFRASHLSVQRQLPRAFLREVVPNCWIVSCRKRHPGVNNPQEIGKPIWLVVGPPLWKIWTSIGMMRFPIFPGK